jgi:hypothetical protein
VGAASPGRWSALSSIKAAQSAVSSGCFLTGDGTAKAPMRKPKLTLGRIRGASLRLGPCSLPYRL